MAQSGTARKATSAKAASDDDQREDAQAVDSTDRGPEWANYDHQDAYDTRVAEEAQAAEERGTKPASL